MVKIRENPIRIDDLGIPLFLETPKKVTGSLAGHGQVPKFSMGNGPEILETTGHTLRIAWCPPDRKNRNCSGSNPIRREEECTWRIIPVRKWLITPIYKPFGPFIRGITPFRGLTNHGCLPLTNWDDPPSRDNPFLRTYKRILRDSKHLDLSARMLIGARSRCRKTKRSSFRSNSTPLRKIQVHTGMSCWYLVNGLFHPFISRL